MFTNIVYNRFMNDDGGIIMEQRNMDVLMALYKNNYQSQRAIANETGHALGMVNKALRTLVRKVY